MLFSLTMFPIAETGSLARPVSDVVDEIDRAGLKYQVTGMDTVIEGDWDTVMPVIRKAEERLRKRYDRVYMQLALDDHVGASSRLRGAVADVERELGRTVER